MVDSRKRLSSIQVAPSATLSRHDRIVPISAVFRTIPFAPTFKYRRASDSVNDDPQITTAVLGHLSVIVVTHCDTAGPPKALSTTTMRGDSVITRRAVSSTDPL